jgi:hypothetical protein
MATYEIWLTNDEGVRLAQLDDILSFSASRVKNAIGYATLQVKPTFDTSLIKVDNVVQIWRAPTGGTLSLWRPYFVRKWKYATRGGVETLLISGPDVNDLLRRRLVAAYSGQAPSEKTDYADDMMKEIVTEAMSDVLLPVPTAGTRAWADLSVQSDVSAGPLLTASIAWKRLLQKSGSGVLTDLAKASVVAGTEIFFDIAVSSVTSSSMSLEFRTKTGQPGADLTATGLVFDQERGNLSDAYLEYDYTDEVNYVYAGGSGIAAMQDIQQVYDATRYGASQWARCEGYADACKQSESNGVREVGRAALEKGKPIRRFGGIPLDVRGCRFGKDWNWGDKCRARYRGAEFEAIIEAVVIGVDDKNQEKIQAKLAYVGV